MSYVMLPVQHLRQPGERVAEPQKRLMLAVMRAVVDDCLGSSYREDGQALPSGRSYAEAVAYVTSTDRKWPFSFENVCDVIGLDPNSVRQRLLVPRSHSRHDTARGI